MGYFILLAAILALRFDRIDQKKPAILPLKT